MAAQQMDQVVARMREGYRLRLWRSLWRYLSKWAIVAMRDQVVADLNIHITFRDGAGFTLRLADPRPPAAARISDALLTTNESVHPEARMLNATVRHLLRTYPDHVQRFDLAASQNDDDDDDDDWQEEEG